MAPEAAIAEGKEVEMELPERSFRSHNASLTHSLISAALSPLVDHA